MRTSGLLTLTTLAYFTTLALATPFVPSTPTLHAARSQQTCQNAPGTIAGTGPAPRSSLPDVTTSFPIHRRDGKEIFWCAQGTHTYIGATLRTFYGNAHLISDLLASTYGIIETIIRFHGDGAVDTGHFEWNNFNPGTRLQLAVQNSNNHQITYGVLMAAIHALDEYMRSFGYSIVEALTIYDGANEVATATLKVVPS